jgi:hypothetical protein
MTFRPDGAPGHTPRRHLPVASPRLRAALVATIGISVLAIAGVLGRVAFAPAAPDQAQGTAPQVWISSLLLPELPAAAGSDADPLLPARRVIAALPPGALVVPGASDMSARPPWPAIALAPSEAPPELRAALTERSPTFGPTLGPTLRMPPATAAAPAAVAVPQNPAVPAETARAPATGRAPDSGTETGLARSPVPPVRPAAVTAIARSTPLPAPSVSSGGLALRPTARPPEVARLAARLPGIAALPAPGHATPAALAAPPLQTDRGALSASGCTPALTRAIPRRPSGAEGGRAAMDRLANLGGTARDAAIVRAIEGGNIPEHLRALVPVTLTGTDAAGRRTRITLCVTPDYLAVGSDRDFVRVPMGLPAATRVADRFEMILPTARMVDAIHAQAQLRLAPAPMTPGAQMSSTAYFVRHNATVEGQRSGRGATLGLLVSGHKKDLVLTNRLSRSSGRVAIYGWHRANGQPIQPLSTVHGQNYADYSHGVRLVSRTAFLDGRAVDLRDLLADGRYAGLLTGEGPIATRTLLAALR